MNLTGNEKKVLQENPRAIYHMRSQLKRSKLMPIFGAGVGHAVGLPNWSTLVDRISRHTEVDGELLDAARGSNTSRTQMLYQHFRRKISSIRCAGTQSAAIEERSLRKRWSNVVYDCLYATAKPVQEHPYLRDFAQVVRSAPLTVNYNFDDYIEAMLDRELANEERENRGYESVWEPSVQYRSSNGVIYHPNGYLPKLITRNSSSWLIFADDAFADQLIDAQRGQYSTLLSHLFRFTALLIGLSLDDPTLKHLLRQNAHANPGHVHYYVAYCSPEHCMTEARRRATIDSNFETYNLVTLFLDEEEIAALGRLLALSAEEFAFAAQEFGLPRAYTFFLSGAVGVGKTTCVERFKALTTFDEWVETKPELLLKAAADLNERERIEANEWIDRQFRRKNFAVARAEHQVCVVDRSLLDPLAFTPIADLRVRLAELRRLYSSGDQSIAPGSVLLLLGYPEALFVRTSERRKGGDVTYVQQLQDKFRGLWTADEDCPGVRVIETMERSVAEVVRAVSRVVHLEPYATADLWGHAEKFVEGSAL